MPSLVSVTPVTAPWEERVERETETEKPMPSSTQAVHAGVRPDELTGAVLTPIYQSTTFAQESVETYTAKGYSYSRCANPTVRVLEEKIGLLEGGAEAAVFTSGMAATVCVMSVLLSRGDHCVVTQCSYGGTNRLARVFFQEKFGVDVSFVSFADPQAVRSAIIPGRTRLVLSETPTNPVLELADVQAISDICQEFSRAQELEPEAREDGAGPCSRFLRTKILHVCDSTLSTPFVLQPLRFGADVALVSITKYYDGHNMATGGAVVCKDARVHELVSFYQNVLGSIITPTVAFVFLQNIKTMKLRVEKQSHSALAVAQFLAAHPKVSFVRYPGLPTDPQYALAQKQHINNIHGGMVAFEVKGGTVAGRRFMNSIQAPWVLAENLGAAESICTCPAVFTHANMTKEDRLKVGITDGLIRLSVGLEEVDDLVAALAKCLALL